MSNGVTRARLLDAVGRPAEAFGGCEFCTRQARDLWTVDRDGFGGPFVCVVCIGRMLGELRQQARAGWVGAGAAMQRQATAAAEAEAWCRGNVEPEKPAGHAWHCRCSLCAAFWRDWPHADCGHVLCPPAGPCVYQGVR